MDVKGFIGKSTTTVDNKGRCSFPKELRKYLEPENLGKVVITIGSENSLTLYPVKEWNAYVDQLDRLPRTRKNNQFRHMITNMAKESVLDGQNRVSLNEELMKYAGITGEATFTGDGKTVGIWNPERYQSLYMDFDQEQMADFEEMFYWDEPGGEN